MPRTATPIYNPYVFAIAATAVAAFARWLLEPVLADHLPLLTFYIAVALSAWYCGPRSALLAGVLGFAAALALFVQGTYGAGLRSIVQAQWDDWLQYVVVATTFAVFGRAKKDALERAELRRETLQVTLSSIAEGVIVTDVDGRITSLNPVAEALTGWKSHAARGLPLEDVFRIVDQQTRAPLPNPGLKALELGQTVAVADNDALVAKDGAERSIANSAAPIRAADGALLGVVLIFRDVSAMRTAERALRTAHEELGQAHGGLQQADRRKNDFFVTLARELRDPLAPLRAGLQTLQLAGTDAAAIATARTMMERQVTHIIRLVDDLLDVDRISRGAFALNRKHASLTDIAQAALAAARASIEQQQHRLTVSLPPEPLYVDADAARLTQALSSLLLNAAKYTPKGGAISFALSRSADSALITVTDDGAGIPQPMLGAIFEMFTQVGSDDAPQIGLGIGLTVARRLIELHGGSIEANSEGEGQGSQFTVRLPLAAQQARYFERAAPAPSPAPSESGARRVLIADDNEDAAASLATMLDMLGNDVRTASDGQAALELGATFEPNVVLLDIGMPTLNGYDAARRIRGTPWGAHAVIVALTGRGRDEDKRLSHEAGFDFHLVKPVDSDALEQVLALAPAKKA